MMPPRLSANVGFVTTVVFAVMVDLARAAIVFANCAQQKLILRWQKLAVAVLVDLAQHPRVKLPSQHVNFAIPAVIVPMAIAHAAIANVHFAQLKLMLLSLRQKKLVVAVRVDLARNPRIRLPSQDVDFANPAAIVPMAIAPAPIVNAHCANEPTAIPKLNFG